MPDDDLTTALLAVERRGWDALCDGTAAEFYGSLMTDDGTMVLGNGAVLDRDAVVAALRGSPSWLRYEIDAVRLVRAGADAAAIAYTGRAWREEGAPPFVGAMTSLYVREHGGWRLALYTQTPVP
jgi:hypothetical protein